MSEHYTTNPRRRGGEGTMARAPSPRGYTRSDIPPKTQLPGFVRGSTRVSAPNAPPTPASVRSGDTSPSRRSGRNQGGDARGHRVFAKGTSEKASPLRPIANPEASSSTPLQCAPQEPQPSQDAFAQTPDRVSTNALLLGLSGLPALSLRSSCHPCTSPVHRKG